MAVETKFVVVRKGEEKMTFASKKEADAYDKMLDMAETFTDWLMQSGLALEESQAESMALLLAEQKETVQHILRTSKLPEVKGGEIASEVEASEKSDADEVGNDQKIRAVKAA
ncbi:DNA damage-inducible SOS regulon protein [Rouxiella silvae]|uniref:DNA damage-inducible SOS regulon protein n=1 Tax=Rouxiella silvae TaxID=1646373 RepID=A0ABX3U3F4_9GAMM|nr:YebG family protein [Rouxiella silvae]ORJ22055.1 DNA damage-inducible SOS regulon protein [Rouxiella silvae]